METQNWKHRTAKLALALAIIRSKPEQKSCREYTEHLAKLVSSQDDNCKEKVLELKAEVLHLRQQLLLAKMHEQKCLEEDSTQEYSEDLGATSQLLEDDSGCDIYNEDMGDMSTLRHCPYDSPTPSSPLKSSSSHLPIMKHYADSEKQLFDQMHFLNHLLGIRKLSTVFTELGHECNVIADTVSGLFDGLLSLYCKPMPSICIFQTEAIGTVTRLFTDSQLPGNLLKKCIKNIEEFEKFLIQHILADNEINRFQMQQPMANCLTLLGKCKTLRGSLINLLLCKIKHFVDELLFHHQNQTRYDIAQYENIFVLCQVLESLLQYIKEELETLHTELLEEEAKLFIQRLDKTILYLSEEFPLFSLCLWRLGTLCSHITK